MTDVWHREEIESPCVKVCVLHPQSGLCLGCHRTARRDRRLVRHDRPPPAARVMAELPARAPLLRGTRRGGRAGRHERK